MERGCRNCMWLYHMVSHNPAAPCSECLDCNKWQTTKKTHYDEIRAMSDEELATFLVNNQVEVFRQVVKEMRNLLGVSFPYEELTKEVTDKYEEMKKEQLDWLKEGASE